jgi:hypothetical protein
MVDYVWPVRGRVARGTVTPHTRALVRHVTVWARGSTKGVEDVSRGSNSIARVSGAYVSEDTSRPMAEVATGQRASDHVTVT